MKKLLAILLTLAMSLSLAACGGTGTHPTRRGPEDSGAPPRARPRRKRESSTWA